MTAWQLQCCGEPFAVGSEVTWGLVPTTKHLRSELAKEHGDEIARQVTHYETHHSVNDDDPEPIPTRGRVEAIEAAFCLLESRATDPRYYEPVAGSGVLERRESADGWEPEDEPGGRRYRSFQGYIVELAPLNGFE